jgi:hypothetical protein
MHVGRVPSPRLDREFTLWSPGVDSLLLADLVHQLSSLGQVLHCVGVPVLRGPVTQGLPHTGHLAGL